MSEGVYLYEHINHNGYYLHISEEGNYNVSDLISMGVKNDDISSLRIIGNYKVQLYEHHNYGGNIHTSTSSISNFVDIGWNDKVSSIKVRKINAPNPSPTLAPDPVSTQEPNIYKNVRDAVVTLSMIVGTSVLVGSGFFIKYNSQYYICTAAHNVITSTRNTKIDKVYASISNLNNTGIHKIVQCTVIGVAGYADLAVLKVNETINNQKYLEWGNSRNAISGDRCYVFGDPMGIDAISITDGVIRDNVYIYNTIVESMCISAPIYGGNSGGPITDVNGKLVGLVSYGYNNTDTLSWGTAQSIAKEVIHKIINTNTDFIGGTFNAVIYPVDAIHSYVRNLIPNKLEGYYVHSSYNNKLNKNDRITKISNKTLGLYHNHNTPSDIYLSPGNSLTIEILRTSNNTEQTTLSVYPLYIQDDKPSGSTNTNIDIKNIGPIIKDLSKYQ
jgi:S1-C subfamily serine protease